MAQALRIARSAWRDFRVCWPDLVATDLLIRLAAIVVLGPAMSLLFGMFLAGRADGVLRDTVILEFLLHPAGLLTMVILAAVSLGLLFAEFGALMVIGFGASVDRRVSPLVALRYAYRRLVPLIHIAGLATGRLLLLVSPCLAGLGAICWFLLGDYDINYYLAERPPEFLTAIYGAMVLAAIMALLVIYRVSSWLLAVPMVLFESAGGSEAMRQSAVATSRQRWPIAGLLCAWLLLLALLSVVVTWATGQLDGAMEFVAANRSPVWLEVMFRRPLLVAATGLVVACFAFLLLLRSVDWNDTAIVIAHRGGASVAPENTIAVYAWTINDPVQMSILLSRNVDGIITDDVAMARQVLAVRAEITPLGRLLIWLAGETGLLRSEDAISGRDDA